MKVMRGRETWLEVGIALFFVGLLVGLGVIMFGRVSGGAQHARQHGRSAPDAGSVPEHRHQHISSNAAR
jgi:hypothetical protein